jgi:SAM-dependent methyltransferase
MKPARTLKQIDTPQSWAQLPNGKWIAQLLQTRLDPWNEKLFGYHYLKLGGLSGELSTKSCNIYHQVCVDKHSTYRDIMANFDALPFLEKSFDVCLLAHLFDFNDDPHQLLREVDRVMMEDGYLILTGFNPLSLMTLVRYAPTIGRKPLYKGRCFMPMRIKDWLSVLNYEVIQSDIFSTLPPIKGLRPHSALSQWLSYRQSWIGGVYFIVARKRTTPLKPIKPSWALRPSLSPLSAHYHQEAGE